MSIVYNHDVKSLHDRMNRFIVEINKAGSGNVAHMVEFDKNRLTSYLESVRRYVSWVVAQPQLDMPETNPREFTLDSAPEIKDVENEDINEIVRLMVLARDELASSQSARLASGILPFDQKRLLAIVEKIDKFLSDYIDSVAPMDLPETAPMKTVVDSGNTGAVGPTSNN